MYYKQYGPTPCVETVQYLHFQTTDTLAMDTITIYCFGIFGTEGTNLSNNTKVPSCLEHTCIIVIMNISSPTAPDEPRLPIEPSSTTLYPWPLSSLDPKILQIFYPTIHPPKLRFPHSPAAFEFGIHDSSGYFIIVHSLCCPCSRQPYCFNRSDYIR